MTNSDLFELYFENYRNIISQVRKSKFSKETKFDLWHETEDKTVRSVLSDIINSDRFLVLFELYLWSAADKALDVVRECIVEVNNDCFCVVRPRADANLDAIINLWLREPISNVLVFNFCPSKSASWYLEEGKLVKFGFRITNEDAFMFYE